MIATAQIVIDWITSLGWLTTQETAWPIIPGPEMLDAPERLLMITGTGGPGYVTEEGGCDAVSFQARLRGASNDPTGAEAQIKLLDSMILGASFPVTVDGVTISSVHREGSPPVPLPLDPADRRFEYTANYIIVLGS